MKLSVIAAGAALVATAAAASPAAAWVEIGQRNVADHADRDVIAVGGHARYRQIKICVYRNPVRFYDVDVFFENGGRQEVRIAARVNPGRCTRVIDLKGAARDIEHIAFTYEETSVRRRTATVKVFAR
ncbi:MAG: hypothetical protein GC153_09860 [Alphaproteobacteria bacterium]|nr:hypothetical protein [Alphaproteobacteria bacterium]